MPSAYWGMAYAMGPNINNMPIEVHQIAQAGFALQLAKLHSQKAAQIECDLIDALAQRYPTPVPAIEERLPINKNYANAMRELYNKYPDDSLVAALFAESLMILRPWNHWTKEGHPAEETPEIVAVLENSLKKWPTHPGLCHFYIHTMEASPQPEKALQAANSLRNAMPGAGHLVHMPSHIDVLLGNYEQVIETNRRAIEVDKMFLQREGAMNFYTFYRIHNYHFLVYGAMFDGQSELAMTYARELVRQVPDELAKKQSDFLDAFMAMPLHVMIRFGQWEKILEESEPPQYLPASRALWHYARAISYAATGRVKKAKEEQTAFLTVKSEVPETSMLFNNTSRGILSVAEAMISGEIEYRDGDFDKAFEHLREAVERDDSLNYDEPWGWMQPARHALGALLLEQKRYVEAESTYRQDLKHRPNNPWSLHGLAECLKAQGKLDEARKTDLAYQAASKRSDIKIDRSCFCKLHDLNK
jgi:tetratricopeptide (TPR) repeat protein